MVPRVFAPLVGAALLAFGAIFAACGDNDGELTLEEYFHEFGAISDDMTARFEALQGKFPGLFEEPATTRDALDEMDEIYRDGLQQLDDMDPPDNVKKAHNEFRDRAAAQRQFFQEIAGEMADVESASELEQVLMPRGAELEAVTAQTQAACLALQGIADDNIIAVDLGCQEE